MTVVRQLVAGLLCDVGGEPIETGAFVTAGAFEARVELSLATRGCYPSRKHATCCEPGSRDVSMTTI